MANSGVSLRLSFNFPQLIRGCGWTETYDTGYASLPAAIAGQANLLAFMTARTNCLGIGPVLVEAEIGDYTPPVHPGDPPVRRNTLLLQVPPFPTPTYAYNTAFESPDWDADYGTTVLYISLQTNLSNTPIYRRSCWIAGLPDAADLTESLVLTDPATQTAVNAFLNCLKNFGNGAGAKNTISIRSVARGTGNPIMPCTAWNPLALSYTVPFHGFVENQPIVALGMRTVPGGSCPRGKYLVGTVIDASTFTLQGAGPPTAAIKTGGFKPWILTWNAVATAFQTGMTKRNKGRPSGLSVGRAKKKRTVRA
jgi:hypothetical protein